MEEKKYGEYLFGCSVSNGVLTLPGMDANTLPMFYNRFTQDLFNMQIPHYRVVGFYHDYDQFRGKTLFRTTDQFKCSIIELSRQMRYVVPIKLGGNDPEKGCFCGVTEDLSSYNTGELSSYNRFNEEFGTGIKKDRRTNFLMRPHTEIGCLEMNDFHIANDVEVIHTDWTTSSMWYAQTELYDIEKAEVLIPDKYIAHCESSKNNMAKCNVFLFYMRGTGHMGYQETQLLFSYDRCTSIMPCDTKWDLSEFFVVRVPNNGDTDIKLTYLENINEHALETILHDYGRELMR